MITTDNTQPLTLVYQHINKLLHVSEQGQGCCHTMKAERGISEMWEFHWGPSWTDYLAIDPSEYAFFNNHGLTNKGFKKGMAHLTAKQGRPFEVLVRSD